jgi:glyoxylase-like metal-dependent hydrolase (beta-lactamase superfamily II)
MKSRLGTPFLAAAVSLSALPLLAQSQIGVQKLTDGVWAAQPANGSNVGWFLYGDSVVAVDSGGDAATAKDILKQIADTTGGKPVRHLVLTHAHADHAGGARAFVAAGAQVICQENAAAQILNFITPVSNDPANPPTGKRSVAPTLMSVSERLILFDGRRRADIQWLGPAHTNADLVVLLPAEKVLFAGDLASNGRLPDLHLPDSDPDSWAKALPRLAAVPVEKMVPGHGTIGPTTGIADTAAYLRALDEIVQRLVRSGTREEYVEARLREPDNRIPNVPLSEAHLKNAIAVYRREKEKRSKPSVTPTKPSGTAAPRPTPPRNTSS